MGRDVDPVTQHHVNEMIEDLCAEFGDRFERGRIEDMMADSVSQLAGQAQVEDFLPVLAYRFTRERLNSIGRSSGTGPDVVFISLNGGGRGQIAAALTTLLSDGEVSVHAAGTSTHGVVDPVTEAIIGELGIDTSESFARPVNGEILANADVIVTMGHSVGSVELPDGVRHEDWRVGDPSAPVSRRRGGSEMTSSDACGGCSASFRHRHRPLVPASRKATLRCMPCTTMSPRRRLFPAARPLLITGKKDRSDLQRTAVQRSGSARLVSFVHAGNAEASTLHCDKSRARVILGLQGLDDV